MRSKESLAAPSHNNDVTDFDKAESTEAYLECSEQGQHPETNGERRL
jgi:hypothetical protein